MRSLLGSKSMVAIPLSLAEMRPKSSHLAKLNPVNLNPAAVAASVYASCLY